MGAEKIWDAMEVLEEAQDEDISPIPSCSRIVETSLPFPRLKLPITDLCRDLFKKWSSFDDSRFTIEKVSGGITNLLLKVIVREDNGTDVLLTVRLYGPNTEYVIDRKRELQDSSRYRRQDLFCSSMVNCPSQRQPVSPLYGEDDSG